ncbi:MAG: hypothetical protein IJR82_05530, partial [Bacilli bacterium]|nr:hypothetical protein [Bacilli bacterium]
MLRIVERMIKQMKKIFYFIMLFSVMMIIDDFTVQAYDSYKIGDIINFKGEDYYVISNSDENSNYVTVFKVKSLTTDEINQYGLFFNSYVQGLEGQAYEYEDGSGGIAYYSNNGCSVFYDSFGNYFWNYRYNDCNNDYKHSDVKKLLDRWSESTFNKNDLVAIDGYKYRLIMIKDLNNLGYTYECRGTNCTLTYTNEQVNDFMVSITENGKGIWTMSNFFDSTTENIILSNVGISFTSVGDIKAINPVININKNAISNDTDESEVHNYQRYKSSYKFGEEVMYKGELYYVLKDSNDKEESVTLLKDIPLTNEVIQKYYDGEIRTIGKYGLVHSDSSNYNEPSSLKIIVDGWVEDTFGDDAYELDSYKARLLTGDELIEDLYFEYDRISYAQGYIAGDDTPDWVVQNYNYWTMTDNIAIGSNDMGAYHTDSLSLYFSAIRPVVNVKKRALSSNECDTKSKTFSITNFKHYIQGEKVIYNNEEYYVANNSGKYLSRVTLIKEHPLTADEIDLYGYDDNGRNIVNNYPYSGDAETIFSEYGTYINEQDHNRSVYVNSVQPNKAYRYPDGIGGMQYYSSEECGIINNETIVNSGCKRNYDDSYVKIVIDNWAKSKTNLDDLISVNGYKARLINKEESKYMNELKNYVYLGSNPNNTEFDYWIKGDDYYKQGDSNTFILSNTSVLVNDYINGGFANGLINKILPPRPGYYGSRNIRIFTYPAVWPVINVDKCALEGGCEIEDITMEVCDDPEPIIPEEPDVPDVEV